MTADGRVCSHCYQAASKSDIVAEGKNKTCATVGPIDDGIEWTLVHGYYATMGGFVIDLDEVSATSIYPSKKLIKRWTVTPQGLQLLAECGLLPNIKVRDITDKNKSDSLAKAIVLLQASWLIVSSIARLGYDLPVTLLEVNTIGHVICAIFIYGLWWHKPRDIKEPTVLEGRWIAPMAAYMMMSSDTQPPEGWREWTSLKPPILPEFSNVHLKLGNARRSGSTGTVDSVDEESVSTTASFLKHGQVWKSGFGCLEVSEAAALTPGTRRQQSFHHHFDPVKTEDQSRTARWRLALDALEAHPHLRCRLESLRRLLDTAASDYQPQVMLQERASNWPTKGSIPPYKGTFVGMALWFASIAFGAVHVAAWNEYFPSLIEKWLWRSSSLYLAWAGSVWLTICFLGTISKRFLAIWDTCLTGRAGTGVYVCLVPVCTICGLAYAFARVFLVVESIVSLREMPPKMYWNPNWPQVIPHL